MTTASAAYSSVPSIPPNTLLLSAEVPSGPVTWELSPFASARVIARMESAAVLALLEPFSPRLTGTMVSMALPSAAGIGPTIWPRTTPWSPANLRASAVALARSAAVTPEARSYTTIAVETLGDWTRASTSRTLVDSAPAGTHCEVSFFSAPLSFFDSGKATTSTTTQKPTTSHLVQLPVGISAILRSVLTGPPRVGLAGRLPGTVARPGSGDIRANT